jgi:hypothetical protein
MGRSSILGEKYLLNFDDLALRFVCVGTRPESFPKRGAPSGNEGIPDFHNKNPLNINRLS